MVQHDNLILSSKKQETLYAKIQQQCKEAVWRIKDPDLAFEVLENFGPHVSRKTARHDLMSIYDVAFHRETATLLIANKGATLYSLSPRSFSPYITRHLGLCLYMPQHGTEVVNVGLVGNIYQGRVVLRSESACTPSFLFGSQRCNCAHQWDVICEVAASFNRVTPPAIEEGRAFERWVQEQFTMREEKHYPKEEGLGFILMHIDTQNGMGSGYTSEEYTFDLYSRASLRHRGEYTAEQVWQTTMAGGFHAIGIPPDPRKENEGSGYRVTSVVLDYLNSSKDVVFLTNNPLKIKSLAEAGYAVTRIKSIGEVSAAGAQEAYERGVEFSHLDINHTLVAFEEEFRRLCAEIEEQTMASVRASC